MSQAGAARTTRPRKGKVRPVIILHDVPKGYNWGWYSREDPRMHLQTVDSKHFNKYKVWLEKNGKRVLEPAGDIPAKLLKSLAEEVNKLRRHVEGRWTNMMIEQRWLTWSVGGPLVTLTAYPAFPGSRFTRTLDLADYFQGIYDPTYPMTRKDPIKPEEVTLSEEMAALEIFPEKEESLRSHIFLPTILWQD